MVLADGTRVPIETDTIFREGDSPTGESAAKIGGGAIGGAIIGGIFGGAKGAAIGASAGAGAGTAAVMAGGRNAATLPVRDASHSEAGQARHRHCRGISPSFWFVVGGWWFVTNH